MTEIQNKNKIESNKKPAIGTDSLESRNDSISSTLESGKTIRTTRSHPYLAKKLFSFVVSGDSSWKSHQDYADDNKNYNKINDHHNDIFNLIFNNQRLNAQQSRVADIPTRAESISSLSKIAGKNMEAKTTIPVSEAISESLFNWVLDNSVFINHNYTKSQDALSSEYHPKSTRNVLPRVTNISGCLTLGEKHFLAQDVNHSMKSREKAWL